MKNKILALILCAAAAIGITGCTRVSEEPVGGGTTIDTSFSEFVSPVYEALSDEEKALYDKV